MLVRRIMSNGEMWFSEKDIRRAMHDEELIQKAAAMLKHAFQDMKEEANDALAKAIGFFYTEATGALRHQEN